MRIRPILIVLGLILASPFLLVALWIAYAVMHGSALKFLGYPVDVSPTELAQEIFDTHGDPLRCRQLQQSVPTMGPSLTEQRMLCFHTLAALRKDPGVCEFLMPSEYGLSCINEVISQEYKDHPDSGFFDYSECENVQKEPLRQDWCNLVKTHHSHKIPDCTPILNDVIHKSCILKFQMWDKYPELRHSLYFGKQ